MLTVNMMVDEVRGEKKGETGGMEMEKTMKVLRKIGKIMLVVLGAILMPVLIWVALGVAIHYKVQARKAGEPKPTPTFGEVLAATAGRATR